MPRYTTNGSVIFVRMVRKDGKAKGVMRRKKDNEYATSSLSLNHDQNSDCTLEPTNNNTLDLKQVLIILEHRKQAKEYIDSTNKTNLIYVIEELNLDEDKRKVLDLKFIKGLKNYQVAMETNRSLENVNNIVGKAYDKVFKLIKKGIFK